LNGRTFEDFDIMFGGYLDKFAKSSSAARSISRGIYYLKLFLDNILIISLDSYLSLRYCSCSRVSKVEKEFEYTLNEMISKQKVTANLTFGHFYQIWIW